MQAYVEFLAHVGLQVKLADCVEREGLGEGCAYPS
jgi:hypothetical protein